MAIRLLRHLRYCSIQCKVLNIRNLMWALKKTKVSIKYSRTNCGFNFKILSMKNNCFFLTAFVILLISCNKYSSDGESGRNAEKEDIEITTTPEDTLPPSNITKQAFLNAPQFTIPADSTEVIHGSFVSYSPLRMGNNSKIIFMTNADTCKLDAFASFIGTNCEIVVTGERGSDGSQGPGIPDNSTHGQNGGLGYPGEIGKTGNHGKVLVINIGFNKLGSLRFISEGGQGGTGGKGGRGQRGGKSLLFPPHSGGDGGPGGKGGGGGDGGMGGSVFVDYWFNDDVTNVDGKYEISIEGGNPGKPGTGGDGGDGGSGQHRRRGGNLGPQGPDGEPGQVGRVGPTKIDRHVKKPS